jgi:hypothetical protein
MLSVEWTEWNYYTVTDAIDVRGTERDMSSVRTCPLTLEAQAHTPGPENAGTRASKGPQGERT